jgi:hypothetical protein
VGTEGACDSNKQKVAAWLPLQPLRFEQVGASCPAAGCLVSSLSPPCRIRCPAASSLPAEARRYPKLRNGQRQPTNIPCVLRPALKVGVQRRS